MPKARRISQRDHVNIILHRQWDRRQERLKGRRQAMEDSKVIEALARMWMQCDPNRGGSDPDEVQEDFYESGGTDGPAERHPNPQAGQPRWKWFVPRAQASLEFLKSQGLKVSRT